MALSANTVSVGLGTFCLQRVGFELVQVAKRPQPGDPVGASTMVLRPLLQWHTPNDDPNVNLKQAAIKWPPVA